MASYDKIGQLTVGDSSVNTEDRGYKYDAGWNLNYRTNNGTLCTFTVDNKNELTNQCGTTMVYDGNGNLIASGSATNHSYVYDDENRLIQWFWYQNVKVKGSVL
jgi:YD repeat-containing protein